MKGIFTDLIFILFVLSTCKIIQCKNCERVEPGVVLEP